MNPGMIWAGIGSRITPIDVLHKMTVVAYDLDKQGYVQRSGGATGADTAFEKGVKSNNKIILRPEHATRASITLASTFHPAWERCNEYARLLHGRNAMIIMGEDLQTPAKFVLYWAPSETHGGTAMGVAIAKANKIPTYNFKDLSESDLINQTWL